MDWPTRSAKYYRKCLGTLIQKNLQEEPRNLFLFQTTQELKSKIIEEWNNLPQKEIK